MHREIKEYNYSLRGTDWVFLLSALLALAGMCVVGYAIRWVEFCNESHDPYRQAAVNIVLICATGLICSLACARDSEPKQAYKGALLVGVYMAILPTTMFFGEYLWANLFFCFAFYRTMRFSERQNIKGNIFFATFWILISSVFVPQAVFLIIWIYLAILVFAIEDIRHLFIPIAAFLTFAVYYTTYSVISGDGMWAMAELFSYKNFELKYTDKIFSVNNYYFYWTGLAVVFLCALWSYFLYSRSETTKYQKRFVVIFSVFLVIISIVLFFSEYKYLNVFFIMPFVLLVNNFFYRSKSNVKKEVLIWYLGILGVISLWLFK